MNAIHQKFSWLRLVAAILVAFIGSLAWFALYCEFFGFVGPYWANVLLGFFGVFIGGFYFQRRYRSLGSVVLLVGGVAVDGLFEGSDDKVYPLSVIWVAVGGLVAVAFYYLRSPLNKSPEPKTPLPQPGDPGGVLAGS
jgi:hypothetical protein